MRARCAAAGHAGHDGPRATGGAGDAPAGGAPAPAAPIVSDWNAAPTDGSPGVNVPKLSGNDLLRNNSFDGGKYIPWNTSFSAPGNGAASVKDGQLCVVVTNKGVNAWDAQVRHREMVIQKGHTYSTPFLAHADKPIQMKAKIGMSGPPYKEYWTDTSELTTHPQTFVGAFTMESADDASAEFAFFFGGGLAGETVAPYTVCLDDIHLDDPQFARSKTPTADEAPIPNVLVNQTGYLTELPKLAVIKTPSKNPLKWELHKKGAPSSPRVTPGPSARTPPRATTCRLPTSRSGRRQGRTTRSGSLARGATRSTSGKRSTRS